MNTPRQFREQICDALGIAYDTPADEIVERVVGLVPMVKTHGVCPARLDSRWKFPPLPHEPDSKPVGLALLETCRHCRGVYRPALAPTEPKG